MMRSSVDFPAPFWPSTPILAAGYIEMLIAAQHLLVGWVHTAKVSHREDELVRHTSATLPARADGEALVPSSQQSEVYDIADRYVDELAGSTRAPPRMRASAATTTR